MLDAYYTREAPLPLEMRAVFRLVMAQTAEQREAVEQVLREFFAETPDGWRHKRCDAELTAMQSKRQKAAESARAKWAKANAGKSDANAAGNDANAGSAASEGTATNTNTNTNTISVPNGTGGEPPKPADVIFALGVPLLTASAVTEKNARSMLGLMRKSHGDAAVIAAIQRCADERPVEPVAWLQGVLKARPPPRKSDGLMAGNIAAAQRFLQGVDG